MSVNIEGTDVTNYVYESEWKKPATIGVGTFKCTLVNTGQRFANQFAKGMEIVFYFDNVNGSYKQFVGRIDNVKDTLDQGGQFLEINGRHTSYLLTETRVCYSATNKTQSDILKEITDKFAISYSYLNLVPTTTTTSVRWDYKIYWDCVMEICKSAQYDCRIDNDKDIHFFPSDSIINYNESIVEGDTFRESDGFGEDDFYRKTRVTAIGQDDQGVPIVYTAIASDEGTDVREAFVNDTSMNTFAKVVAAANSELADLQTRPPQNNFKCVGLPTLEPGEDVWVVIPRQNIYGIYKAIQVTHKFGIKTGMPSTEVIIEKLTKGYAELMHDRLDAENQLMTSDNENKLLNSYNFTYDDDTLTESHSSTKIDSGNLVLSSSGVSTGTWISKAYNCPKNISFVELRVIGNDLSLSTIWYSVDNGSNWYQFTGQRILVAPSVFGMQLKCKIILNKDTQYVTPLVASCAILYS